MEFFGGGTVADHDIFNMYYWITPCMGQSDKISKGCRRTLSNHLDSAIRKVPYVSMNSCRMGTVRNKVPVSYSLNTAFCHGGDPFHGIFSDPRGFIDWEIDPEIGRLPAINLRQVYPYFRLERGGGTLSFAREGVGWAGNPTLFLERGRGYPPVMGKSGTPLPLF